MAGNVHEQNSTTGKWGVRGANATTDPSGNPAANSVVGGVGPTTPPRNRIRTGLAETYAEATNTVTWPASDDIHEVTILVTATTAVAAEENPEDYCLVSVNAPNAATAAVWLTLVDSQDTDSQADKFKIGERYVIRSRTVITRLDFLPIDITASIASIHLWVGAH